ncbi:hypothetical protein ACHAXR_005203 [Thalassiosira sp. AJA248-18]
MSHYNHSDYSKALFPQFDVPDDTPSLRICVCCREKIINTPGLHYKIHCACGSCVYCSEECKCKDTVHHARCVVIGEICESIRQSARRLELRLEFYNESLKEDYPENLYEFGADERDRHLCQSFAKSYFFERQTLIKMLVRDGVARTDSDGTVKTNDLAFDIAIMQCRHLFILDKYDSFCCRADGLGPKKEIGSPNHAWKEDITTSFFLNNSLHHESFPLASLNHMYILKQMLHEKVEVLRMIDCNFLNNHDCISTIGEYLGVRRDWLVFEKDWYKNQAMEILCPFGGCKASEAQFGKLYGCSELFLGITNFKQINEIKGAGMLKLEDSDCIHCDRKPLYRQDLSTSFHPQLNDSKSKTNPKDKITIRIEDQTREGTLLKCYRSSLIIKVFEAFAKRRSFQLNSLRFTYGGAVIAPTDTVLMLKLEDNDCIHCVQQHSWEDTLHFCKLDHDKICMDYIQPRFEAAVRVLNDIAGYDAISTNFYHLLWTGSKSKSQRPDFIITRFVTDAMKICQNHLFAFEDFIEKMNKCDDGALEMQYHRPYDFSYGLMAALIFERKIAQAFYYISLSNGKADPILDLLPEGRRLRRVCPPPFDQNDPFLTFPLRHFTHSLTPEFSDRIKLVSRWMPDVTDVIDALFNAGLASDDYLSQIFGHSSLVVNTVWGLQQEKIKRNQPSIVTSMMSNELTWEEGCTLWDPSSGLKIHYLTIDERRERFIKADTGIKRLVTNLRPSIGQFEHRFASDDLGIEIVYRYDLSTLSADKWIEKYSAKTHKYDLDEFKTIEKACRHFFDASTLEEAIFDCVGIPRILILNGDEKNMWNSGWKYKGRCFLGDQSVRVGKRIAIAIDKNKCSHCETRNFWEES